MDVVSHRMTGGQEPVAAGRQAGRRAFLRLASSLRPLCLQWNVCGRGRSQEQLLELLQQFTVAEKI